jgi:hypothetical protein
MRAMPVVAARSIPARARPVYLVNDMMHLSYLEIFL